MSFSFNCLYASSKTTSQYLLKLYIFLFTIVLFCLPISYGQSLSAEQIYKKVSDAVVVILAYDDNNKLAAQGSGVVLNDKGYVVTNFHVLSNNQKIEILHGKEVVPYVDIIGFDIKKDILILKIKAKKFHSIKIGNSDSLNIGERIYAIGSPLGLENTISEGIISGLRNNGDLHRNFIQITASISPGSSGGAVVNDKGELIGISSFTFNEGQNLNFAIPIGDILKVKIGSYSKNDIHKKLALFKEGVDTRENKTPKKLSAKSIIDKYIRAIGGKANLEKVKDKITIMRGSVQGMNLSMVIYQKEPDKIIQELDAGVMKQETYYDGKKGIVSARGTTKEITGDALEAMKYQAMIHPLFIIDSLDIKTKLLGTEKVNGKEAYKIEVTLPTGKSLTEYYDLQTGFKIKDVQSITVPQGTFTKVNEYSDFRDVDGVIYPFKLKQKVGPQSLEMTISSIKVNTGIPDSKFEINK